MNEISIDDSDKEEAMTTTHLFVELLVIGFGAVLWIVVFGAALFGYDHVALDQGSRSLAVLLPLLSLAYVLGIVIDRVADQIFDRWDRKHLEACFRNDRQAYYEARRTLVVHGPELWAHLEYGRSRLRICRGWAFNAFLLLVALDVLAWVRHPPALTPQNLVVGNLALILLCLLCVGSWSTLNCKEYEKIQSQSAWITSMRGKGTSSAGTGRGSSEVAAAEPSDVRGEEGKDEPIRS